MQEEDGEPNEYQNHGHNGPEERHGDDSLPQVHNGPQKPDQGTQALWSCSRIPVARDFGGRCARGTSMRAGGDTEGECDFGSETPRMTSTIKEGVEDDSRLAT
ncbi:hypothetical protein Purlil1_7933 [Purpureocillium lilacinum]|uniref:Uncharacterized protein n=1 Tax=Purpureocillium lilacinum TaxID=33203 RepID=A0ABR0BVH1_PURLI|nr:hypothetical protein Purlil1_7933 [Purpureocillium lilacinum]